LIVLLNKIFSDVKRPKLLRNGDIAGHEMINEKWASADGSTVLQGRADAFGKNLIAEE
jgi:hypothetical protein